MHNLLVKPLKNLMQRLNIGLPLLELAIEISVDCNSNCLMFPHRFEKIKERYLSFSDLKSIVDQAFFLRRVVLLGRGDPLRNPEIFKIMNYLDKKGIKIHILVPFGTRIISDIKKLKSVSHFFVTVDSYNSKKYINLRTIKQVRADIHFGIQVVLTKERMPNLTKFVEMAKDIGADELSLIHLIGFDKDLSLEHASNFPDYESQLQKIEFLAKKYNIILNSRPPHPENKHCYDPWYSMRIAVNGDVYPCCYIHESSADEFPEYYKGCKIIVPQGKYILGNIFKDPLNKIWNGKKLLLLRQTIRGLEGGAKKISEEELNIWRREMDPATAFAYCKACLFRWNCAC